MPVCFFLLVIALLSCQPAPPFRYAGPKIEGVNLVAPPERPDSAALTPVRQIGTYWVAYDADERV